MGNCKCEIGKICGDNIEEPYTNNNNKISTETITIQNSCHFYEADFSDRKPCIHPYSPYINFYSLISKLILLQRHVRRYIYEKRKIQKKIEFEIITKKRKDKDKNSVSDNPHDKFSKRCKFDCSVKKKTFSSFEKNHPNTQIININFWNNIQNDIINEENQAYSNIYTQNFDLNHWTNSFSSNSMSFRCDNTKESIMSIKGYFLKKTKKFKYTGFYNNKKQKQGFGIITWDDSSKLMANFQSCKAQGYCKFFNYTGSVFFGYYVDNRPMGYGIYNMTTKVRYEGNWVNNSLEGFGIETWEDETYYQGQYLNGWKNGIGLYRWPDGMIYQGNWVNNEMSGWGVIWYPDDRLFQGELKEGLMNGFGEFLWPDGKRYIGYYKDDKKCDFGIFYWSEQPLVAYCGFWENGKMHGLGLKINSKFIKYGIWKEGRVERMWNSKWNIGKYVGSEQTKYLKFLEMTDQMIINAISKMVTK